MGRYEVCAVIFNIKEYIFVTAGVNDPFNDISKGTLQKNIAMKVGRYSLMIYPYSPRRGCGAAHPGQGHAEPRTSDPQRSQPKASTTTIENGKNHRKLQRDPFFFLYREQSPD